MHTCGASFGWLSRVWSLGLPGRVFLLGGAIALVAMVATGLRTWRLRGGAGGPRAMLDQLRRLVQAGNLARAEQLLAQGSEAEREPARAVARIGFNAGLEAARAARRAKSAAAAEVDAVAPGGLSPGETARVRMTAAVPGEIARANGALTYAQLLAGAACVAGVWAALQTGGTTRVITAVVTLGVFFVVMVTTHVSDLHRADLGEVIDAVSALCDQPEFGADE